jgi:hypothetical protein
VNAERWPPDHASEIPPPTLPERAWFEWRGIRVELERYTNADGYPLKCPKCGRSASLDAFKRWHGREDGHQIGVRADGALTASPSVGCPYGDCGWHVFIREGVALDA